MSCNCVHVSCMKMVIMFSNVPYYRVAGPNIRANQLGAVSARFAILGLQEKLLQAREQRLYGMKGETRRGGTFGTFERVRDSARLKEQSATRSLRVWQARQRLAAMNVMNVRLGSASSASHLTQSSAPLNAFSELAPDVVRCIVHCVDHLAVVNALYRAIQPLIHGSGIFSTNVRQLFVVPAGVCAFAVLLLFVNCIVIISCVSNSYCSLTFSIACS